MAIRADYKTGGGSRPGNKALMRAIGCKTYRGVQYVIGRLFKRRLVERTNKGNGGRGLATIYRIRIEDPRFPGETRKSELRGFLKETAKSELPGFDQETPKYGAANPEVEGPKPRSTTPETPKSELRYILTSNLTPNPTPQLQTEGGGGGASLHGQETTQETIAKPNGDLGTWENFLSALPEEMAGAVLVKDPEQQLKSLVAEHGATVMVRVVKRWIDGRELPVATLQKKWVFFLKEYQPHLAAELNEARREAEAQADVDMASRELSERIAREDEERRRQKEFEEQNFKKFM